MIEESNVFWALLASIAVVQISLIVAYHKLSSAVSRLSNKSTREIDNSISQIESLLFLYSELKPEHGLPPTRNWAASPDFLRILGKTFLEKKPQTIVECSSGVSTVVLAYLLKRQGRGHVLSLEHDREFADITRSLIALHGLSEWATVIDAPLKPFTAHDWTGDWYSTSGLPENLRIDMLVVDGPPAETAALARYPALPALSDYLSPEAIILLDDASRPEEVAISAQWRSRYPHLKDVPYLSAEKGVRAFIVKDKLSTH